jgi:stage V sporulation protein R
MAVVHNRFLREGRVLPPELAAERNRIVAIARGHGLDFYETIFEVVTYEEISMLASFEGFPVRYPHWRWGMGFLEMHKSYELGLSKIYEMVINTDPSYAYLMDCNELVDQKLVMAHVLGHVDFFKNNIWFSATDRRMLDTMANHAAKVRRIIARQGHDAVERFIDRLLSLDNLIDFHGQFIARHAPVLPEGVDAAEAERPGRIKAPSYLGKWVNPPAPDRGEAAAEPPADARFPDVPDRDVLGFLMHHAPLEPWQRELVRIVRAESYYFAPQSRTKIMNEGWATYWHTKMMTEDIADLSNVISYADHHSGVMYQRPGGLNPYKLGVELFRHIEQRWDRGQHGRDWLDCDDPRERAAWDTGAMKGRDKIFQVRMTHNDLSFLDEFLTADFCREQGFFTTKYDRRQSRWVISSREFDAVKAQLLSTLASQQSPRVAIVDAANRSGELRMVHEHEGLDLQLDWAEQTLGHLAALWRRPVALQTLLEGKPLLLRHDGGSFEKRREQAITLSPQPAPTSRRAA